MREMFSGSRHVPRKTVRILHEALLGVGAPLLAALVMTLAFAAQETPVEPAAEPAASMAAQLVSSPATNRAAQPAEVDILCGHWASTSAR